MKHLPLIQGTDAWRRARFGMPTASEFDKVITAKKWVPSESRRGYQIRILTELILDTPLEGATTPSMIHGTESEEKARACYEMMSGMDVEPCGLCVNDEGTVGASPDGFLGEDGSLEIKSPERPQIHCEYLLRPQSLVDEYFVQVQGQLFVTGRKWTDLISYFSGMPMVTIRVTPHAEFQQKLDVALRSFVSELSDLVTRAKAEGWIKPKSEAKDYSREWISQEDVDKILAGRQTRGDHGKQPAAS